MTNENYGRPLLILVDISAAESKEKAIVKLSTNTIVSRTNIPARMDHVTKGKKKT
jgi:hypothetical protein